KGKGNPHADTQGHKGIWHFYDMANSNRAARPAGAAHPALAEWQRLVAEVGTGPGQRRKIEEAALALQKKYDLADQRSPFWVKDQKVFGPLPWAARASLAKLTGELEKLKSTPPPPVAFANGAQEGGVPGSPHARVHDVRIHLRGSYS